jgi:hypothetical protein
VGVTAIEIEVNRVARPQTAGSSDLEAEARYFVYGNEIYSFPKSVSCPGVLNKLVK